MCNGGREIGIIMMRIGVETALNDMAGGVKSVVNDVGADLCVRPNRHAVPIVEDACENRRHPAQSQFLYGVSDFFYTKW